jgi:hypothetical protein
MYNVRIPALLLLRMLAMAAGFTHAALGQRGQQR